MNRPHQIVNQKPHSTTETAAYVGVTATRIRQLAVKNVIPGIKVGSHWRFDKDEVAKILIQVPQTNEVEPFDEFADA